MTESAATKDQTLTGEQAENEALFKDNTLVKVYEFAVHSETIPKTFAPLRTKIRFLGVDESDCISQYIVHKDVNIQRELVTKHRFIAVKVNGPFMARFNDETSLYEIDDAATKEMLSRTTPAVDQ